MNKQYESLYQSSYLNVNRPRRFFVPCFLKLM